MNALNLEATKKILANAGKLAEDEGYAPMAFVVIDGGGNMIAAHRQDGATHWRIGIADGKAQCALGMGTSSRKIAEVAEARPAFVQSLMAMTGGKVVTSPGGGPHSGRQGRGPWGHRCFRRSAGPRRSVRLCGHQGCWPQGGRIR